MFTPTFEGLRQAKEILFPLKQFVDYYQKRKAIAPILFKQNKIPIAWATKGAYCGTLYWREIQHNCSHLP